MSFNPHSFLESPFNGEEETIHTLIKKATFSQFSQLGILPRSDLWRDQIESIIALKTIKSDVSIHLWEGFSLNGKGIMLSKHIELLQNRAM